MEILLRVVGGVAAVALFVVTLRRYRLRQISRLNLLISSALTLFVAAVAIWPSLFGSLVRNFIDAEPGDLQALISVTIVAVVVLFGLVLRAQSQADTNERSIRLLVEALSVERFDWAEARRRVGDAPMIVTISPAYDEAENVGPVIHAMPTEIEGRVVVPLVIDDHSDDATSEVARSAGALVARLPIRRGGGMALRVGYEIALQLGAEIVVTLDADGQHLPEEMPILLKPIFEDQADHVNGSRMLGDYERGPLVRHLGVHFFSWVVTILTGQRVTDISSGYRATRAETLRTLFLKQDQFWASEVTIEALRQRARVVEVPVTFLTRRGGESKKPKTLRYGWNFSKAIIQTWLR
ncbi:MAG TPA: glycosyltransferase [Actinomycetota bacterium]|jgi:hypothetical protein